MEWTKEREWTDEWSVMGRVFVEDRVFRDGKDKQRIGIVYISIIVCKFGFSFAYVYTRRTKSNFPTSSWNKEMHTYLQNRWKFQDNVTIWSTH